MRVRFCGAAREVTGSSHLITLEDGYKILLDCGLYQGNSKALDGFNESWLFDPAEIDCLILSHAHIDHTGKLPKLIRDGFKGSIYATHATRSLAAIMLLDSAGIQEKEAQYEAKKAKKQGREADYDPLYTSDDVAQTLTYFIGLNYEKWFHITENVAVYFTDAGHILGSASVTLQIKENGVTKTIGFTGDIGRPNRPILRDPQPMPAVSHLICESTYGDRLHTSAPEELDRFCRILTDAAERGGRVIIPAFSVGRTQEIVYMMDQLATKGLLPRIPVYVDSPLAVDATDVFIQHPECYDADLNHYMQTDPNPFGFRYLKYLRKVEESKALNAQEGAFVVISSSGMANAGRVKHHIFNNVDNPNTTILIVGYASPQTPAGQLRDGAKVLHLFGEAKIVQARVEVMDSFSAHADYKEIIDFLANQKGHLKQIYLVHGDYDTQQNFAQTLQEAGFPSVHIPELGESVAL